MKWNMVSSSDGDDDGLPKMERARILKILKI